MMRPLATPNVRIRAAVQDDAPRLQRLAELDSASVPAGRLLVGEVDGELWAARQIQGKLAIADPFRPTADLLEMLALRAAQLVDGPRSRGRHARARRLTALRPQ